MKRLPRPFGHLFAASATSDLADGISRTVLPLLASTYTRNPLLISGLVTSAFLPWLLFALASGALVDRVDRRRAMAAANVVRAVVMASLAGLTLAHLSTIAVLYVVAFAMGMAETVYDCAVRAILPQIVDDDHLDTANSAITVEETVGQTFVGAPLGSALFALAVAAPLVINATGFAVAAAVIMTMRGGYRPPRSAPATSMRRDVADGVRWLVSHRLLRGLTLVSAATAFANSMVTGVLVLYVLEVLRLPAGDYGFVAVAGGVGAVIGGLATPPLARRYGRVLMLTAGAALSGISVALMGLTRNGYLAAALFATAAAGVLVWNVLTMSLRQALIPEALFGRVQGAYRTVVWGAIPVGATIGGVLADLTGLRSVFVAAGAAMLAMAFVLNRLLRAHRDELTPPTTPRLTGVASPA